MAKILIVGGGFGGSSRPNRWSERSEVSTRLFWYRDRVSFYSIQSWSGSHSGEASRTTFPLICARPAPLIHEDDESRPIAAAMELTRLSGSIGLGRCI